MRDDKFPVKYAFGEKANMKRIFEISFRLSVNPFFFHFEMYKNSSSMHIPAEIVKILIPRHFIFRVQYTLKLFLKRVNE